MVHVCFMLLSGELLSLKNIESKSIASFACSPAVLVAEVSQRAEETVHAAGAHCQCDSTGFVAQH